MTETTVQRFDISNMRRLLSEFPKQVEDAVRLGKAAKIPFKASAIKNVVVTGLGGSAIGGDILRSYTAGTIAVPFILNRHYILPEFVNRESLVIVSSYSGDTEETIAAYLDARKSKALSMAITSGGEIGRMAKKFSQPVIKIPKGFPPRAALAYSFFPMLIALTKAKLISSRDRDIAETIALLKRKSKVYASLEGHNPALDLAKQLYNKMVIVYSSCDTMDAVNLRWRGQIAENAKQLTFGHVLPEMNHNELVGWKGLQRIMAEMAVVFLRDNDDHERVQSRMKITKGIVSEFANRVIDVPGEGRSSLARIFSLIYLGDWTSYYLALLNGVDPTPVRIIDYLKWELGKTR